MRGQLALLLASCCSGLAGGLRIPWWSIATGVLVQLKRLEKLPRFDVDFSAGAGALSSPEKMVYVPQMASAARGGGDGGGNATSSGSGAASGLVETPLLLAHQMGKRIVKKLPDSALLGVLVLIASELLQREVNTKFLRLPPLVRELVNSTALELDAKLEFLSSLQWDVDPFLRAEIENLQNQPLELVDKFVVTEILPRVDRELSPMLNNLIGDPRRVSKITASIKELIQSASVVVLAPGGLPGSEPRSSVFGSFIDVGGGASRGAAGAGGRGARGGAGAGGSSGGGSGNDGGSSSSITSVTSSLVQSVDRVGESVEEAIKDWNKIILELGQLVKAESILHLIPDSLGLGQGQGQGYSAASGMRQWQRGGTSATSAPAAGEHVGGKLASPLAEAPSPSALVGADGKKPSSSSSSSSSSSASSSTFFMWPRFALKGQKTKR